MITSVGSVPRIAVVILNWNGCEDTLACLASVEAVEYPNYWVVIVDNGSTDGSVEAIRGRFPHLQLLETGQNLGYAGGNNVGIRAALESGADYVLLLNNDTVVAPDLLRAFSEAAYAHPDGGMFSARIEYYDEPGRIWYAGVVWNRRLGQFDGLAEGAGVYETDVANGCAMFVPAGVVQRIGLLDERFFLTYEETDWCFRAREAGYKCYVVGDARVRHKVSVSIGGSESPLACYFWVRNQLFWARRHLRTLDRAAVRLAILRRIRKGYVPPLVINRSESVLRTLIWAWASWWRGLARRWQAPSNKALLIGLRDYFKGRMGDCPETIRHWTEADKARQRASANP